MILSMSSSRAVSMRIGTSDVFRILRHSSTPSPSGRLRSRIDERGRLGGELEERRLRCRRGLHCVPRVPEVRRDERGDRCLVLDDENRVRRVTAPSFGCGRSVSGGSSVKRSGSVGSDVHSAGSRLQSTPSREYTPASSPTNRGSASSVTVPRPTADTEMPEPRATTRYPPPSMRNRSPCPR